MGFAGTELAEPLLLCEYLLSSVAKIGRRFIGIYPLSAFRNPGDFKSLVTRLRKARFCFCQRR